MNVSGGSIVWILDADTGEFSRALLTAEDQARRSGKNIDNSLGSSSDSVSRHIGNMRSSLDGLTNALGTALKVVGSFAATSSVGFLAAAKASFDQVRQVENASFALKAYEKDAGKVNAVLSELVSYARSDLGVLFQRQDLFDAASTLKIYGVETSKLTEYTKIMSKGVAVGKTTFQELSEVLGQVVTEGKLTSDAFEVLARRGIKLPDSMKNAKVSAEQLFQALNTALPDEILEGRANTIDGAMIRLQSSFRDLGGAILGVDKDTSKFIEGGLGDRFVKLLGEIRVMLRSPEFVAAFDNLGKSLGDFAESAVPKVIGAIRWTAENFSLVLNITKALIIAFVALKAATLALTVFETFEKIAGVAGKVVGGLGKVTKATPKTSAGGGIGKVIANILEPLGKPAVLKGAASAVLVSASLLIIALAIGQVSKTDVQIEKILVMVTTVGILSKLFDILGKTAPKAILGAAGVAAIALSLAAIGAAIGFVNSSVPSNIGDFAKKMAVMGIAIVSVGALSVIASNLLPQILLGSVALLAIAGTLTLIGLAVKSVNKSVPSNIGDFSKKIANVSIAVVAMGVLAGVMGAIVSTGVGAVIIAAGLLAVIAIAGALVLIGKSIGVIDKNVPSNIESVKTKIRGITEVAEEIAKSNLGNVLKNFINTINITLVASVVSSYVDIGLLLQRLERIQFNSDAIIQKINLIKSVINTIAKTGKDSIVDQIVKTVNNFIETVNLKQVSKIVDTYHDIAKKLSEIQNVQLNAEQIVQKINLIGGVVKAVSYHGSGSIWESIQSAVNNFINATSVEQAGKVVNVYGSIIDSLNKISTFNLNVETIKSKIDELSKVVKHVIGIEGGGGIFTSIGEAFTGGSINEGQVSKVQSIINKFTEIAKTVNGMVSVGANSTQKIDAVRDVVYQIGQINEVPGIKNKELIVGYSQSILNKMTGVAHTLNSMPAIDRGVASGKIAVVRDLIYQIGLINESVNIANKEWIVGMSQSILNKMTGIAQTLTRIPTLDSTSTVSKIQTIRNAIYQVGLINEAVGNMANKETIAATAVRILDSIISFGQKASTMPQVGQEVVASIKNAISAINTLGQGILNTLQQQAPKFTSIGQLYGTNLANGINAASPTVSGAASNMQSTLHATLQSRIPHHYYQGIAYANALANGIISQVGLMAQVGQQLQSSFWRAIEQRLQDHYHQGRALAQNLVNGTSSMGGALYNSGANATQGFINGVNSKNVYDVGWRMADKFLQGLKVRANQNSPWKTTQDSGKFAAEGLAVGIRQNETLAVRAANHLADAVLSSFEMSPIMTPQVGTPTLGAITPNASMDTSAYASRVTSGAVVHQENNVYTELDMQRVNRNLSWELSKA